MSAFLRLFGGHQVKSSLIWLVILWIASFAAWWKAETWDLLLCLGLVALGLTLCHVVHGSCSRQRMEYVAQLPFASQQAMLAPFSVASLVLLAAGLLLHLHESSGVAYWEGLALQRVLSSVMGAGEIEPGASWHARPLFPLVHFLGFPVAAFWIGTLSLECWPRIPVLRAIPRESGGRAVAYALSGLAMMAPAWLLAHERPEREPVRALAVYGGVLLVLALVIARSVRARIAAQGVDGFPVEEDTWDS